MDIKVNQINKVTQPEAAAPVRESDDTCVTTKTVCGSTTV